MSDLALAFDLFAHRWLFPELCPGSCGVLRCGCGGISLVVAGVWIFSTLGTN